MIIKHADSRQQDLDALRALAERPDISAWQRRAIEGEHKAMRYGVKGEKESAYHLDFHLGHSKNNILIHDLRIEHDGRVAQIDHLLISRFLDIWLFESKNFGSGLSINSAGECTAWYGRKSFGIPSPFEQNRRHVEVVDAAFRDKVITLPTRLGMSIRPAYEPRVLVSPKARITRPPTHLSDLDTLVKADQVKSLIDRDLKRKDTHVHTIAKLVSRETLSAFGERLVAAHRPAQVGWAARFGLAAKPPAAVAPVAPKTRPANIATAPAPQDQTPPMSEDPAATGDSDVAGHCAACARPVSDRVVAYCADKEKRFGGHTFCYGCQRNKARREAAMMAAQ